MPTAAVIVTLLSEVTVVDPIVIGEVEPYMRNTRIVSPGRFPFDAIVRAVSLG